MKHHKKTIKATAQTTFLIPAITFTKELVKRGFVQRHVIDKCAQTESQTLKE